MRSAPAPLGRCSTITEKSECERDETAFIRVDPVARQAEPASRHSKSSSLAPTARSCTPVKKMPPDASSRIEIDLAGVRGFRRSFTSSL